MSNKTQLQANNTQLASLIQTLQGKIAGGGGGNLKIFNAGLEGEQTQCGNYRLTYMCPLDELDFSAFTIDNLTMITSNVSTGGYIEVYDVNVLAATIGVDINYRVKSADETIYGATTLEGIVYMPEYNYEYTMFTAMAKITPEVIAAAGLSIEPGIYMTNRTDSGFAFIYTGP